MKKVIFTFLATCFMISQGIAQITLDQWDVSAPLMQYLRFNDTLPLSSVQPGSAGANQTWDLTTLQHHTTDTLIFTASQWTPFGSSFPSSNLCMMTLNGSEFYSYMKNDADSLTVVGQAGTFMGSPLPLIVNLNPSQKILQFPATYPSSFNTTSKFQLVQYLGLNLGLFFVDSIKIKDITTTTTTIDGWGNITTPLGTYDCLRSQVFQISQDSIWAKNNTFGIWIDVTDTVGRIDTIKRYTWWAKNIGYALANVGVDPVTNVVIAADYLGALPQPGGIEESNASDNAGIYPNPASNMINISSKQLMKSISIYNTHGALIKYTNPGCLSENINVSDLPKGIYIVRIVNNNDEIISNKKLVID